MRPSFVQRISKPGVWSACGGLQHQPTQRSRLRKASGGFERTLCESDRRGCAKISSSSSEDCMVTCTVNCASKVHDHDIQAISPSGCLRFTIELRWRHPLPRLEPRWTTLLFYVQTVTERLTARMMWTQTSDCWRKYLSQS